MSMNRIAVSGTALALAACASAQPSTIEADRDCPASVGEIFESIVGDWSLSIQADEGWTGYGESTISWASDKKCGVYERSLAVFDQESESPSENSSTAHLIYDELSETIKLLMADDRGYVHIGIAVVETPLRFNVLKLADTPPNRQVQFRNIEPQSFEWSWNGRASPTESWEKRLTVSYQKKAR